MNKVILVGRLTKEPELLKKGQYDACDFSLAINKFVQGESVVTFIPCTAWGINAKNIVAYVAKGSLLLVEGELAINKYQDQYGNKREKTYVNVAKIEFIGTKKESTIVNQNTPYEYDTKDPESIERVRDKLLSEVETMLSDDLPF